MVGVIGSTSYIQDVTHYINYVAAILFDFFFISRTATLSLHS